MTSNNETRVQERHGSAVFSLGLRPFFLFGAAWVGFAMIAWIAVLTIGYQIPSRFDPVSWHSHAFLFGYVSAVLAGFLLTAVPNWTGRAPIMGWWLAALFALWWAGRAAVFVSATLPGGTAALIDLAFPVVLGGLILREIIAGRNWRNLVVIALLAVFTIANGVFHFEASNGDYAAQGYGLRLGLATAIMMIAVIGGRIVPAFTRNWFVRGNDPARPVPPMQLFDKMVLVISAAVLIGWVADSDGPITAVALLGFGILHLVRLFRWQGLRTLAEPLVWVLHVSYVFIPLGAFVLAADGLGIGGGQAAAQHIWMAGAIGSMTLAVMTRATLGHTGQSLEAGKATVAMCLCLHGAVVARWLSGIWPDLIVVSAVLWIAAFAGFVVFYGPLLLRPKPEKL